MDAVGSGVHVKTLQAIFVVLILGGILTAGLWPFHSPKNDVRWLPSGNGLSFGTYGSILSSGVFSGTNADDHTACSLEIWVVPGLTRDSSTLLAFYDRGKRRQLWLRQSLTDLELSSESQNEQRHVQSAQRYANDVFRKGKQLFITMTSNGNQARVYIDGAPAADSQFPLSADDFGGELVIANSPVQNDSWQGQVRGLAIYQQELTPPQVLEHYQTWTKDGRPATTGDERNSALYLFDEGEGNIVHDRAQSGVDLYIPERYTVFDEKFLEPAWDEYSPDWSYIKNVLINIAGFIPLGFIANAFFSSVGKGRRAVLFTILLGCATTLTIEISQAFLPTRDSGTTDLFTNTLGTCLGAAVYHYRPVRILYFAILNRVLSPGLT